MEKEFEIRTTSLRSGAYINRLIFLISVLFTCPFCLYIAEVFPRYLQIPVSPPEYYEEKQIEEWGETLKIIFLNNNNPFPPARHFGYRLEAYIPKDEFHGIMSRDAIISYFDRKLGELKWKQSDEPADCALFLPERNFLNIDSGEIVSYRRNDYNDYTDYNESDLICVAAWKNSQYGFNVVLLSVRSSLITMLVDFFF